MVRNDSMPAATKDVFNDVLKWDRKWRAFPAFEEILEYEFLRREGSINMLSLSIPYAADRGLYNLAAWIHRCLKNKVSMYVLYADAIHFYTQIEGTTDVWLKNHGRKIHERVTARKIEKLEYELASLKKNDR